MRSIWIIHRDAGRRAALARIAGAGDNTVIGHPADELFGSATPADGVVLALSDDFELELQFAHRQAARLRDCHWIVLAEPADLSEARRLFDTLGADFLAFPPTSAQLRHLLQRALRRRRTEPLSTRGGREQLTARFGRWFRDMEAAPELLRALDPKLTRVPLLIRGEPGTGRGLLARYVHAYADEPASALRQVVCPGARTAGELLEQIDEEADAPGAERMTIWLADVDRLPIPLQRRLRDWIDFNLPGGPPGRLPHRHLEETVRQGGRARSESIRWIATASEEAMLGPDPALAPPAIPALDAGLGQSLAGLTISIAPLRERPQLIEPFLLETTLRWCHVHQQRARRFDPDAIEMLRQHPWPGNLRELESVLHRTLAATSADIVLPVHLRFEGETSRLDFREAGDARPASGPAPRGPAVHDDFVVGELIEDDEPTREELIEAEALNGPAPSTPTPHSSPTSGSDRHTDDPQSAADGASGEPAQQADWARLVQAIAHEVRNPLVSIRTFSELLPRHYEDEEFRTRFSELVTADARRIEEVLDRLQCLADLGHRHAEAVDLSALLEHGLAERREEMAERRLDLETELDGARASVFGDRQQIRGAFDALIDRALAGATPDSELYVACKHHEWGLAGEPTVRTVIRFGSPEEALPETSGFEASGSLLGGADAPEEVDLAYVLADAVVRAQGGTFVIDSSSPGETLIAVDLPAAASATR